MRTALRRCRRIRNSSSGICIARPSPGATFLRPALRAQPGHARRARSHRQPAGAVRTDADAFREIERYTKLFWINTGPYNNLTARKFVLKTTPEQLSALAHAAADAGARFPTREGNRWTDCSRGSRRCFSSRRSIRSSPARRRGPAKTSCRPARTISMWA